MSRNNYLTDHEKVILSLRKLYNSYGYARYVMSKFEDYDLYSGNRDYLLSDRLITFTDTDGTLKALKPDITLSIIRNLGSGCGQSKLYYNENVYRPSGNNGTFREISQLGLEVIGTIGTYETGEVLDLALGSLELMSKNFMLDITDIDILYALIENASEDPAVQEQMLRLVSARNTGDLEGMLSEGGTENRYIRALISLLSIYGPVRENIESVGKVLDSVGLRALYDSFVEKISLVKDRDINIDFSIISDRNYYNGIVFRGYIEEARQVVLQGGEYRNLLSRMGLQGSGMGFAVYADVLREMKEKPIKADILAVYSDTTVLPALEDKVRRLREQGKTVFVSDTEKVNVRYRKLLRF
jgi:ATP phosphoribosyltransferase regulatory subunit